MSSICASKNAVYGYTTQAGTSVPAAVASKCKMETQTESKLLGFKSPFLSWWCTGACQPVRARCNLAHATSALGIARFRDAPPSYSNDNSVTKVSPGPVLVRDTHLRITHVICHVSFDEITCITSNTNIQNTNSNIGSCVLI